MHLNLSISEQIAHDTWSLIIENKQSNLNYSTSTISLIGFFFNLTCLIVILRPKFRYKSKFKFIYIKLTIETLSCLIGVGFDNFACIFKCSIYYSYGIQVLRLILNILGQSMFISSGLFDLCLIFERYLLIKNKKIWFNKSKNLKFIIFFVLSFSFVCFLPDVFAYKISLVQANNLYKIELSDFQKSLQYSFVLINLTVLNSLLIILLISVSILAIKSFQKFSSNKMRLYQQRTISLVLELSDNNNSINQIKKLKRAEYRFIQMTSIQLIIFTLMRLAYLITISFDGIQILNNFYDKTVTFYLNCVCYVFIYLVQGSNFYFLIYFNKTFRNSITI